MSRPSLRECLRLPGADGRSYIPSKPEEVAHEHTTADLIGLLDALRGPDRCDFRVISGAFQGNFRAVVCPITFGHFGDRFRRIFNPAPNVLTFSVGK